MPPPRCTSCACCNHSLPLWWLCAADTRSPTTPTRLGSRGAHGTSAAWILSTCLRYTLHVVVVCLFELLLRRALLPLTLLCTMPWCNQDLKEDLLADIEWFLGAKEWYRDRAVPCKASTHTCARGSGVERTGLDCHLHTSTTTTTNRQIVVATCCMESLVVVRYSRVFACGRLCVDMM